MSTAGAALCRVGAAVLCGPASENHERRAGGAQGRHRAGGAQGRHRAGGAQGRHRAGGAQLNAVPAGAGHLSRSGDPSGAASARRQDPIQRQQLRPPDLLSADELPDGLVVADQCGRVIIFNRAAERLTGISADQAVGKQLPAALPLADAEGRCWWRQSRPYEGLSIRTRHPERSLYLPDGTEVLVTIGYVRAPRGRPASPWPCDGGAVRRLTVTLRSAEQRARLERTRAD